MRWACRMVVASAGRFQVVVYGLTDLPQQQKNSGYVLFALADGGQIFWSRESIRTMELHPV